MCTAVVAGSNHRSATRLSAASTHRAASPATSHSIMNRQRPGRRRALGGVSGISVRIDRGLTVLAVKQVAHGILAGFVQFAVAAALSRFPSPTRLWALAF